MPLTPFPAIPRLLLGGALLFGALLLAACGDDDGAGRVTVLRDGPEAVADPTPITGGAVVGSLAGYEQTVEVVLGEWFVGTASITPSASRTRLVARNEGGEVHELVLIGGTSKVGPELVEIEGLSPGDARETVYDLTPGRYLLACLIREVEDGAVEDHFDLGMRLEIIVE